MTVFAVLCGGIVLDGSRHRPTSYAEGDHFGMLGGHVRVLAAAALSRQQPGSAFVFSTGVSGKQLAALGDNVAPEAEIYAADFRRNDGRGDVVLETISTNTSENLTEIAKIIGNERLTLITSAYHVPRVRAMARHTGLRAEIRSAEAVLLAAYPGRYDAEIKVAYASPAGRQRIANESRGLADLRSGSYG